MGDSSEWTRIRDNRWGFPINALSYIDKTYYKCAYTCTNDVSTESVSQLLGPCLRGTLLISTSSRWVI